MEWYLMALKQYAVFSGRSHRKQFWAFALYNAFLCTLLYVLG